MARRKKRRYKKRTRIPNGFRTARTLISNGKGYYFRMSKGWKQLKDGSWRHFSMPAFMEGGLRLKKGMEALGSMGSVFKGH